MGMICSNSYVCDQFLRYFVGKLRNRSPLINRGYWIRVKAVRSIISDFLLSIPRDGKQEEGRKGQPNEDGEVESSSPFSYRCIHDHNHPDLDTVDGYRGQILSLGAGFDSSYFVYNRDHGHQSPNNNNDSKYCSNHSRNVCDIAAEEAAIARQCLWVEVDFPSLLRRKKALIEGAPSLMNGFQHHAGGEEVALKTDINSSEEKTENQGSHNADDTSTCIFSADNFRMIGCDLRDIAVLLRALTSSGFCLSRPTLVLSECVLTYVAPEHVERLIQWASSALLKCLYVTYEQVRPRDAFGYTMQNALRRKNAPLMNIDSFPSVESQLQRYAAFTHRSALPLNQYYYDVLDEVTRNRIAAMEMFDEYEEWHEKLGHYFILTATNHASLSQCCLPVLRSALGLSPLPSLSGAVENDSVINVNVARHDTSALIAMDVRCHAADVAQKSDVMYLFGGYANGGKEQHQRLNRLVELNLRTFQSRVVNVSVVEGAVAPPARVHHTVHFGLDERFFFCLGGRQAPVKPLNDMWAFSVLHSCWLNLGTMPEAVFRHASAVLEDSAVHCKILVCGGETSRNGESSVMALSTVYTATITLEESPPHHADLPRLCVEWRAHHCSGAVPSARHSHSCVVISEDCVLLYGGSGIEGRHVDCESSDTPSLYLLDLSSFQWSARTTSGPRPRVFSHQCILLPPRNEPDSGGDSSGARVVVVGGTHQGTSDQWPESDIPLFLLDVDARQWKVMHVPTRKENQPLAFLTNHRATWWKNGDEVIVTGGGALCFSFGSFSSPPLRLQLENRPLRAHDGPKSVEELVYPLDNEGSVSRVPLIDEVSNWTLLYKQKRPVVFPGLDIGPCTKLWQDDAYLLRKCGQVQLTSHIANAAEFDFVNRNFKYTVMSFAELLETIQKERTSNVRAYMRSLATDSGSSSARHRAAEVPANFVEDFPNIAADFMLPSIFDETAGSKELFFSGILRLGGSFRLWTHYDMMVRNVLISFILFGV